MTTKHEVLLTDGTADNGVWECFTCGRIMRLRMEPYEYEIVEPGNNDMIHHGGVGVTLEAETDG